MDNESHLDINSRRPTRPSRHRPPNLSIITSQQSPSEVSLLGPLSAAFSPHSPSHKHSDEFGTAGGSQSPSTGGGSGRSNFHLPAILTSPSRTSPEDDRPKNIQHVASRGKFEARKLLLHLLDRLKTTTGHGRRVFGDVGMGKGGVGKGKGKGKEKVVDSSSESEGEGGVNGKEEIENVLGVGGGAAGYQPGKNRRKGRKKKGNEWIEETYDLMVQMRDVLILSERANWDLFLSGAENTDVSPPISPSDSSSHPRPSTNNAAASGTQIFQSSLYILSTIVLLSCHYAIPAPRPYLPPWALQSVILDVATITSKSAASGRPERMVQIAMCLLGGFGGGEVSNVYSKVPGAEALSEGKVVSGWGEGMKARLVGFYEGLMEEFLLDLKRRRNNENTDAGSGEGARNKAESRSHLRPPNSAVTSVPTPAIEISIDAPHDDTVTPPRPRFGTNQTTPRSPELRFEPELPYIPLNGRGTVSTFSGLQPVQIYQLSNLIPPLITSLFSSIHPLHSSLPTTYRLHRLIELMVRLKPDVHLDILEVVAYGDAFARSGALSVLNAFWPRALGHSNVASPVKRWGYKDDVYRSEIGRVNLPVVSAELAHQWVPWKFAEVRQEEGEEKHLYDGGIRLVNGGVGKSGQSGKNAGIARPGTERCIECGEVVTGFGLSCVSGTQEAIHLHCLNSPEFSFISQSKTTRGNSKISISRFSHVLPSRRATVFLAEDDKTTATPPLLVTMKSHRFRLVNIFTLSLCFVCSLPLWGVTSQGHKCAHCRQFAHHACLVSSVDSAHSTFPCCEPSDTHSESSRTIAWTDLRRSFLNAYKEMVMPDTQISQHSYEEISIFYSVLWIQSKLLESGIASGTVVVDQSNPMKAGEHMDSFELQYMVRLYEAFLNNESLLEKSLALVEFGSVSSFTSSTSGEQDSGSDGRVSKGTDRAMLFTRELLIYLTSLMRSPPRIAYSSSSDPDSTSDRNGTFGTYEDEGRVQSLDTMTVSLMEDVIARDFQIRSQCAGRFFLDHLCHLGFFLRLDGRPLVLSGSPQPPPTTDFSCIFPLPFLLDPSASVETMVVSIESCLKEPDITVQECGFLILVRRCWPNPFSSIYAFERLSRSIINWLLDEDTLIQITRNHIAQVVAGRAAPGPGGRPRANSNGSARTGGGPGAESATYLASRGRLLERYVVHWLKALHDLDPAQYCNYVFESTSFVSAEAEVQDIPREGGSHNIDLKARKVAFADRLARGISRLHNMGVDFSCFEDLVSRWLDEVVETWHSLSEADAPLSFKSLLRLFGRENNSANLRSSTMSLLSPGEVINLAEKAVYATPDRVDPWEILISTASRDREGLHRGLRWLRVISQSGVETSVATLQTLLQQAISLRASLMDWAELAQAVFAASWHRSIDRQHLGDLVQTMYLSQLDVLNECLARNEQMDLAFIFIRRLIVAFLIAAGHPGSSLRTLDLISEQELRILGGGRRNQAPAKAASVLACRPDFFEALTRHSQSEYYALRACIAKFFYGLLVGETTIDNTDAIVAENADVLSASIYRCFDANQPDLSGIRMPLLLKLLQVKPEPFGRLLDLIQKIDLWENRYQALDTLFVIITEASIPSAQITFNAVYQHLIIVLSHFFRAYFDPEESIRQKLDVYLASLQPAHFEVMSSIFVARLASASMQERSQICNLLIKLRAKLPKWHSLPWATLLDVMFEQEHSFIPGPAPEDNAQAQRLWLDFLVLGLQSAADGNETDKYTLLKLKYHTVRLVGFSDAKLASSERDNRSDLECKFSLITEMDETRSVACFSSLKRVLDSPNRILQHNSEQIERSDGNRDLIGSIFADISPIVLSSSIDISTLSYLQIRNLLDCMSIIVYKHDLEGRKNFDLAAHVVGAVKAVTRLVELTGVPYDLRLFALSICSTFLHRWPEMTVNILGNQIMSVGYMMAKVKSEEDTLYVQGKSFLQTAFVKFATKGLFVLIFKLLPSPSAPPDPDRPSLFPVLRVVMADDIRRDDDPAGEYLRDLPIRDCMGQLLKISQRDVFSRVLANLNVYVDSVHLRDFSAELVRDIALFLGRVPRQIAEWGINDVDVNPLILLSAHVLSRNKQHMEILLPPIDLLLRTCVLRFEVGKEGLSKLLHSVTSNIFREPPHAMASQLGKSVSEALIEVVRRRGRVPPVSSSAVIEVILDDSQAWARSLPSDEARLGVLPEPPDRLFEDCLGYLLGNAASTKFTQAEFQNLLNVSKLMLWCNRLDPSCWGLIKNEDQLASLRCTNLLVWSAVEHRSNTYAQDVLRRSSHVSDIFANAMRQCLRMLKQNPGATSAIGEIVAQAFSSIRNWMLLVRIACGCSDGKVLADTTKTEDVAREDRAFWTAVWPYYEKLLLASELDGQLTPLGAVIWSSFADLVIFLHQCGSALVLDCASEWSTFLRSIDGTGKNRQDSARTKLTRALQCLSDPPPKALFANMVSQGRSDLYAANLLRAQMFRASRDVSG